jgi:hypothetical protein
MNSSQLISGQSLIVFGLAVVALVFLMRRTLLQSRNRGDRQPSSQPNEDVTAVESSAEAVVEKLEVRIFDFAREVEARMQTRIAVLDRLIIDADREILRLQDLLGVTREVGSTGPQTGRQQDPRSAEAPGSGRAPARQPDVLLAHPPPAAGSEREAA